MSKTSPKGSASIYNHIDKKMAEDLTEYLDENGIRCKYLSEIETIERLELFVS